ncbi:hypothetical protein TNCV_296581 [Trichonephila clavipes]|nr:hypothetical protein TNCV_296581 [Trichonephila clavipes]
MGTPLTNTIVITAQIESGFVAKDDLAPFHFSPVSSCVAPLQTEASMVREDTDDPNEGATSAWMAADETVGCTRVFLTMWWSWTFLKKHKILNLSDFQRWLFIGARLAGAHETETSQLLGVSRDMRHKAMTPDIQRGKTRWTKRNSGRKEKLSERDRRV